MYLDEIFARRDDFWTKIYLDGIFACRHDFCARMTFGVSESRQCDSFPEMIH